jgi:hypothetical protein
MDHSQHLLLDKDKGTTTITITDNSHSSLDHFIKASTDIVS